MKIITIMLALACAGCVKQEPAETAAARKREPHIYTVDVYRDNTTGCEYVGPGGGEGIAPRMGADGKQVCSGGQQ